MWFFPSDRIDEHFHVKVTDTALSRDLFPADYHCLGDNENRPIKWMAIESLARRGDFSPASDVWSFGVVLWEVRFTEFLFCFFFFFFFSPSFTHTFDLVGLSIEVKICISPCIAIIYKLIALYSIGQLVIRELVDWYHGSIQTKYHVKYQVIF